MAGRQRTFDLIPTTLAKPNHRPPMTSKAAKKAYQQSKGPKVSRAEQRRLDALEYERIRKEHEKERNAAKAKATRDKKAAKLDAEKQERKKQGLPEPSRFVRASQPTIAGFARSDSFKKRSFGQMNGGEEKEESIYDSGLEDEDEDEEQPRAKRVAIDQDVVKELSAKKNMDQLGVTMDFPAGRTRIIIEIPSQSPAKKPIVETGSDDEFGDFPPLTQSAFDHIDSSALSVSASVSPEGKKGKCRTKSPTPKASPQLPARKTDIDEFPFDDDDFEDLVTTQLLSEAADAVAKLDVMEEPDTLALINVPRPPKHAINKQVPTSPPTNLEQSHTVSTGKTKQAENIVKPATKSPVQEQRFDKTTKLADTRPALQERAINMPPPRLPVKKSSRSFATPPAKPEVFRQRLAKLSSRSLPNIPPSGTQAFLENNFDDFFPSPSQQVRELLDDIEDIDDFPSNTQVAKELGTTRPTVVSEVSNPMQIKPAALPSRYTSRGKIFGETVLPVVYPHNTTKSTGGHNIKSVEVTVEKDVGTMRPAAPKSTDTMKPTLNQKLSITKPPEDDFFGSLISTQDLVLTPQELEEITTPSRAPPKASKATNMPNSMPPPRRPITRGKVPFFTEKEDDLFHAAIHESKKAESRKVSTKSMNVSPAQASMAPGPTEQAKKKTFFQEKEEDILHAVLHESKTAAAKQNKPKPKPKPRQSKKTPALAPGTIDSSYDFDQHYIDEEERNLQAALRESRRLSGMAAQTQTQAVPLNDVSAASTSASGNGNGNARQAKRTLKRVHSTTTDYGDDEFSGCSQELLALC